jgi:hypothetical protein
MNPGIDPNDVEVIAEWNSRPLEMAYLVEALALGEALYRVLHFLESGAGDKDSILDRAERGRRYWMAIAAEMLRRENLRVERFKAAQLDRRD